MTTPAVHRTELHANWRDFANDEEIQRLEIIDARFEMKKRSLEMIAAERQKIMARAIRRMRRAAGKS